MKIVRDQPEAAREKNAGKGAGDGDVEFLLGVIGLTRDTCQTAENKKRDGRDRNAVMLRDHAMAQLVKDDGSEKKNAGDDTQGPMLRGRPVRVLRGELGPQGKSDEEKNDEPAGVQIDGNAENTTDAKAGGRSGIAGGNRRRGAR